MRDEAQPRRKQAAAVRRDQVVHVDVVVGDVGLGLGVRLPDPLVRGGGHARLELLGEARLGPLPPRPAHALGHALLQRREREVQERDEGELVAEHVVGHVRRGAPRAQAAVEAGERPEIEIDAPPQIAAHRDEVAGDALLRGLEAVEHAVQLEASGHELGGHELREFGGGAVLGPPEARDLVNASLDAGAFGGAMPGLERLLGVGPGLHERRVPSGRAACGAGDRHGREERAGEGEVGGLESHWAHVTPAPRWRGTVSDRLPARARCSARHRR